MSIKSVELFSTAVEFLMKFARKIGLGIFDQNYKVMNFWVIFLFVDLVIYTMVTIDCMIEFSGNLEKSVFCLVTYGFAVQVNLLNNSFNEVYLDIRFYLQFPGFFKTPTLLA